MAPFADETALRAVSLVVPPAIRIADSFSPIFPAALRLMVSAP